MTRKGRGGGSGGKESHMILYTYSKIWPCLTIQSFPSNSPVRAHLNISAVHSYTGEYSEDFMYSKRIWSSWIFQVSYTLNSQHDEITPANLKNKKTLDPHRTCMVNWCQGKVIWVFICLNFSIHQHALALNVKHVFDARKYFQSC